MTRLPESDLFQLILEDGQRFFSDSEGLPDIRGFVATFKEQLRDILTERWRKLHAKKEQLPLVVNILINPALFFCEHDAVRAQYSRYFRPIYLFDEPGRDRTTDPAQKAIISLHEKFEKHYSESLGTRWVGRSPFLSLNDIESILSPNEPLPPSNRVISIFRHRTGEMRRYDEVFADNDPYEQTIDAVLTRLEQQLGERGEAHVREAFKQYLTLITRHGGSYHHVTVGSRTRWLGRVYLAFREQRRPDSAWLLRTKEFAFHSVASVALAGTFIRNGGVIDMLAGVRRLLDTSSAFAEAHGAIIGQFSGSIVTQNRKFVPAIRELAITRENFSGNVNHRFRALRNHIGGTTGLCPKCSKLADSEPIRHSVKHCDDASAAFVHDTQNLIAGVLRDVPADTAALLSNCLVFGLIHDSSFPRPVGQYLSDRGISSEWLQACLDAASRSQQEEAKPLLRAVLALCGNTQMVSRDLPIIGKDLELTDYAVIHPLTPVDGKTQVKVEYGLKGSLASAANRPMSPITPKEAHTTKARLLLYFGRLLFEGFEMSIAAESGGKRYCARTGNWGDDIPSTDGRITIAFKYA